RRADLAALLAERDVMVRCVESAEEVFVVAEREPCDLVVVVSGLEDVRPLEVIERLTEIKPELPVVLYAPDELDPADVGQMGRLSQSHPVKCVRSLDRLYDDVALHLHREVADLPDEKREIIERLHREATVLAGKKALIVDDDVRNIFATMTILERHHMQVL